MRPLTRADYSLLADLVHECHWKDPASTYGPLLRKIQDIEVALENHPGPAPQAAATAHLIESLCRGQGLASYLLRCPEALLAARTLVTWVQELQEQDDQKERDQEVVLRLLGSHGPLTQAEILLRGGEGLGMALIRLVRTGEVAEEEKDGQRIYRSERPTTSG